MKISLQSISITSHFEEDPVLKKPAAPLLELTAQVGVLGGTWISTHLYDQLSHGVPQPNNEQAAGDTHVSSGSVWEKVQSSWESTDCGSIIHRQGASPAEQ